MNKINAIVASLALTGVAGAADMDTLDRVQLDAATRASASRMDVHATRWFPSDWLAVFKRWGSPAENGFFVQRGNSNFRRYE